MASHHELQERMLDLLYGLLPEEEAAALRARIDADPDLQLLYGEAKREAELFAEAAKADLPTPGVDWHAMAESLAEQKTPMPLAAKADRRWARLVNWTIAAAACLLLMVAGSGWLYRQGVTQTAALPTRLQVVSPSMLERGTPQTLSAQTSDPTGRPRVETLHLELNDATGRNAKTLVQTTDASGDATFDLAKYEATDDSPFVEFRLRTADASDVEVTGRLPIQESQYDALAAAKGATLQTDLLSPSRATARLKSEPAALDRLAIETALLTRSRATDARSPETLTLPGPRMALQRGMPPEDLAIAAREPAMTPGSAMAADVPMAEAGTMAMFDAAQDSPPALDQAAKKPRIDFYPEGGSLATGLLNRVYFAATEGDQPIDALGEVVNQRGETVATAATEYAGRGRFEFVPEPNERYVVRGKTKAGATFDAALPNADPRDRFTLRVDDSQLAADEPLRCEVAASRVNEPLVLTVESAGVPVAQKAFIGQMGANSCELPLPENASGVLRAALYDYATPPPKLVAERFIYREPKRMLDVAMDPLPADATPADGIRALRFQVTDENGAPTPAVLGVAIIPEELAPTNGLTLPDYYYFTSRLPSPEDAALVLGDRAELPSELSSAKAMDLVLGTQPVLTDALDTELESMRELGKADVATPPATPGAPLVFDNLPALRESAHASWVASTETHRGVFQVFGIIDILGVAALVLLLAMLHTFRMHVTAKHWAPVVMVALVVVFLAVDTLPNPDVHPLADWPAAFASHGMESRQLAKAEETADRGEATADMAEPLEMAGGEMHVMDEIAHETAVSDAPAMLAESMAPEQMQAEPESISEWDVRSFGADMEKRISKADNLKYESGARTIRPKTRMATSPEAFSQNALMEEPEDRQSRQSGGERPATLGARAVPYGYAESDGGLGGYADTKPVEGYGGYGGGGYGGGYGAYGGMGDTAPQRSAMAAPPAVMADAAPTRPPEPSAPRSMAMMPREGGPTEFEAPESEAVEETLISGIVWLPYIEALSDGLAETQVRLPLKDRTYRVVVTAHTDDGRLGTATFTLSGQELADIYASETETGQATAAASAFAAPTPANIAEPAPTNIAEPTSESPRE